MKPNRRQLIISAVATAATAATGAFILTGDKKPDYVWRAPALGGEARVSLYGADAGMAHEALGAVADEIERLEEILSLHRKSSEICQLNQAGALPHASQDLIDIVTSALDWRAKTHGAFDPTVQPLWQAASDGVPVAPETLSKAGTAIAIENRTIRLTAGASITLNGMALGVIADRVSAILVKSGFGDVVVDTGELKLIGTSQRAIGIPSIKAAISIADIAIATSEPKSKIFDTRTFRHHLIDPKTGASPRHWESISVFARTAEMADALSTAFAVLPHDDVARLVTSIGNIAVIGADGRGRRRRFGDVSAIRRGLT